MSSNGSKQKGNLTMKLVFAYSVLVITLMAAFMAVAYLYFRLWFVDQEAATIVTVGLGVCALFIWSCQQVSDYTKERDR